jgi:putative hydrolase of the HAD superfamily
MGQCQATRCGKLLIMTASAHSGERASLAAVRYILFDAVGTLITPDPPVIEAYHKVGRKMGSQLSPGKIRERFHEAAAAWNLSLECTRPPTDEAAERRRWQTLVELVFSDVPDAGGELFALLWQHFAQPEHWRLFDDVEAVLAELHSRGYRLGIASNFDARLLAVAAGHPPIDLPDVTFISSQVGYSKPDVRFFRAVRTRLAAKPHEIVLIGDDAINDTAGAQAAGWRAIQLDRDMRPVANGHIASLAELLEVFPASSAGTGCR